MIDRRDISGISVAILGHAGLIAAIYFWPWGAREEKPAPMDAIQVTLSDNVGLVSAAPNPSEEAPAQATQGEDVPPEDAAPPESTNEPEDKPKPTPPRNDSAAVKPPPSQAKRNPQTQPNPGKRKGLDIDTDFSPNNGPAKEETDGKGDDSQATMTGEDQANIDSMIKRQVQPCADRQVIPAPEARQVWAIVQLKLNPDGSLASVRIVGHEGVNDSNQRYVARVDDAVEAIFAGCTPIRGLPAKFYNVPRGWKSRKFRYRLNS